MNWISRSALLLSILLAFDLAADSLDDPPIDEAAELARFQAQLKADEEHDQARTAAGMAYGKCLLAAMDSGFLGMGASDPEVECAAEREAYAAFLPAEYMAELLDLMRASVARRHARGQ